MTIDPKLIPIDTPHYGKSKALNKFHLTPPSRTEPNEPRNRVFSIHDLLDSSPDDQLMAQRHQSSQILSDSISLSSPRSEEDSLTSSLETTFQDEKYLSLAEKVDPHRSDARYWQQRSVYLEGKVEMLKQTFTQNLKEFLMNHEKLSRRQQSLLEKLHSENRTSSTDLQKWKMIVAQVQ